MKVAVVLLILHAPGGKEITVNADKIVAMRGGEHQGQVVHESIGCVINTNDGKLVNVIETCEEVRILMRR